jgi:hypothetical protein
MKKARSVPANGMRAEYDFSSMKGGVRGKYVKRLRAGSKLVLLEPDVASAFPSDEAVNEALRAALMVAKAVRRPKRLPNTRVQRMPGSSRRKTSGARR